MLVKRFSALNKSASLTLEKYKIVGELHEGENMNLS